MPHVERQQTLALRTGLLGWLGLQGYNASSNVGFGELQLILAESEGDNLVCYSVKDQITKRWNKPRPDGVWRDDNKYLTESFLIFEAKYYTDIHIFNHELSQRASHPSEKHGRVCAALTRDRVLCASKYYGDYIIGVYQLPGLTKLTTLSRPQRSRRPPDYFSSDKISTCCDADSGWMAVVDGRNRDRDGTLDIYDAEYKHQIHVDLEYRSQWQNAAASVSGSIVVVNSDNKSLVVHDWRGRKLGRISSEQVGLKGDDYIHSIGRAAGDRLVLAAGSVTSLHLYTLK